MTVTFDSQSIKNSERGVIEKGFDGHKRIQGRKCHVVTDSNGRLLTTIVDPGNEQDLPAAKRLVERIKLLQLPNVNLIVVDGAYLGLIEWVKANFAGVKIQISKQIKEQKFVPITHRWKVERFISWMSWSRRLSRDYELNIDSSEAWVLIHGIRNTLHFF